MYLYKIYTQLIEYITKNITKDLKVQKSWLKNLKSFFLKINKKLLCIYN